MKLARVVKPEALDTLPEFNLCAMQSRRDLRRIHRVMRTRSIVLRAMRSMRLAVRPLRILELGAGDGSLMLDVARASNGDWPDVELTLLDRQSLVVDATVAGYRSLGWIVTRHVTDVLDWASSPHDPAPRWDLVVASLFLHHFEGASLATLLTAIAARTNGLLACEPSRRPLALAGSQLVGLLGVNAVTRGDAVLSVRAGFRGEELSALWVSTGANWQLQEFSAGLFMHCLCAQRIGPD